MHVQAPQAGEVTAFLLEEGAAVEYKQEVIELAPFFGSLLLACCNSLPCNDCDEHACAQAATSLATPSTPRALTVT